MFRLSALIGILALTAAPLLGFQSVVSHSSELRAASATLNDDFGYDVDLVGNRVFVGMRATNRVQVFMTGAQTSLEAELTPPSGIGGDFGFAVRSSGTRCVVGAPDFLAGGIGSVYVFAFDGVGWNLEAQLQASDGTPGDRFGWSVGMSGDRIVVGAPRADYPASPDQGAVYVFERQSGVWGETTKLTGWDSVASDWFGGTLALEGNLVVCAAEMAHTSYQYSGAVYAFRLSGTTWQAEHKFIPTVVGGTFGGRLDLDGDRLAVGMPYGNTAGAGVVIVHERVAGVWDGGFVCEVPYGAGLDQLGSSVAIVGDRLVAGSIFDWTWGDMAGAAFVFDKVGPSWVPTYRLIAGDGVPGGILGYSVAFDGQRIVVGAPYWGYQSPLLERVYLFENLPAPVGTSLCAGDGTLAPCPCGNESDPALGFGCENGYSHGAHLAGSGSASVAANDLRFSVEYMTRASNFPPLGTLALLVAGDVLLPGNSFGDGLLCIGGTMQRMGQPLVALTGGIAIWDSGLIGAGGWAGGDTRYFQVWYRDTTVTGCGQRFNSSNAVSVTFTL